MRRMLICLVVTAMLTGCVQIHVTQRDHDEPMISFRLVTRIPEMETTTPTTTVEPTVIHTPVRAATPAPTGAPSPEAEPSAVPSATVPPTPTTSPTPCLPDAGFVGDITIPDNTVLEPGAAFEKIWRFRSQGCSSWPNGTRWVFVSGDRMGALASVAVPAVRPGRTADIAVSMTAPDDARTYRGTWRLQAPDGTFFGERGYVLIIVSTPTPAPTPVPPVHQPGPPDPGPEPTHPPPPS